MSRIFIENLPKNITSEILKQKFSEKGEITDIQLRKNKRNAFIGFKQPEQAQNAVDYFNRTFINTSRITVKIADSFHLKRPTSTENDNNDEDGQTKSKKPKIDPFEEVKDDPEFEDFIRLQRNINLNNKSKEIWKDDVIAQSSNLEENDTKSDDDADENNNEEIAAEKRLKKTFDHTVKIRGLPYKIKKSQLKEFLQPVKPKSLRFVPHVKGIAYVSFKNAADLQQTLIKHRGFIDGHRIEIVRMNTANNDDQPKNSDDDNELKDAEDKEPAKEKPPPEPISESGRIFIRNLSYQCTEDDLRQLFEKYGPLTEVYMPIDSFTKKPKGFAFVTFMFPEHAIMAFNELDKIDFQGRLIHLLPSYSKSDVVYNGPPPPSDDENDGENNDDDRKSKKSKFKQNKMEENRKDAQNERRWNTLFIRPNAVADIMSENLNINKLELLTKTDKKSNGDNPAVRLALGETQIVQEIKKFLIKNNVNLESFARDNNADNKRSRTTILVKNLPANTTSDEIRELFERFGPINRIVLPPYGLTAIVEMQELNEAKFAFKKLAYTNFKHYPLYLEWAPEDVFSPSNAAIDTSDNVETNDDQSTDNIPENKTEEEPPIEDGSTIFVKNLNFDTDDAKFRQFFEQKIGPVHSATIATKKSPKGILSMGYGFIQFYRAKHAKDAIKKLQNTMLDDHKIEIKLSNKTMVDRNRISDKNLPNKPSNNNSNNRRQNGTKICVKNVPFEAKIDDLRKIFSTFGEIKSIRMPKKLTGTSQYRGFGFVDFTTKEDAKRAFDALSSSTHLYGRPLVLEWAKNDSLDTYDDNNDTQDDHSTNNRDKSFEKQSQGVNHKQQKQQRRYFQ